jgi:hypothetical protein
MQFKSYIQKDIKRMKMRQCTLVWISICWMLLQSPLWAQQSPALDSLLKVYRKDASHAAAQQLNNIGCEYYAKATGRRCNGIYVHSTKQKRRKTHLKLPVPTA